MYRTLKKMIAVILAIWLPLFSGNALAVAVVMHSSEGCRPAVMQQEEHQAHQTMVPHQQMQHNQLAASPDQSSGHQDQLNSPCENCGICHLACTGYLAAPSVKMPKLQPSAQLFADVSALFYSTTPSPLNPPPLVLA